ncbi:MAG: hypothetical protein HS111_04005 [Kofleriaceae bacterium]|nr:hypothetical protein [Kofleriaceae bacterium]
MLERALDLVVGEERPEVHLRLGRILERRASHDAAARHRRRRPGRRRARPSPPRPAATWWSRSPPWA